MPQSPVQSETGPQLVPFPSFGYLDPEGSWRLNVAGIVRHPYAATLSKRMLIGMLGNVMQASEEDRTSLRFRRRVTSFVMDGAHGLSIRCRVGSQGFQLKRRTQRNGHYFGWVPLEPRFLADLAPRPSTESGLIRLPLEVEVESVLRGTTTVELIPSRGISVVSDIDDTIKESSIRDRRELLANTFLRDFRAVPGMSTVYRGWQGLGTALHYVSSSPWQLLPWIDELLQEQRFPQGSLHLRNFRLRTHMLQKVIRFRRSGKGAAIRLLLKKFPERRFIFVGDSGEKDLEIYRKLSGSHRAQALGIFIRDLEEHPLERERLARCRASLPDLRIETFRTAEQLQEQVSGLLEQELAVGR
jgi:phosphatidate phosphatase APP1